MPPNGYVLAMVGNSSTKVQHLHPSQIVVKMFNYFLLPHYCQYDVVRCFSLVVGTLHTIKKYFNYFFEKVCSFR